MQTNIFWFRLSGRSGAFLRQRPGEHIFFIICFQEQKMFYEELDALFALVIGVFVGVVAAVVLCIIVIFIPETGMTARSLAWLLLTSVAISLVPGFFFFWMAGHHRYAGQSAEAARDCAMAAAKGSAPVTEMAGAKDRGMKSDERRG